jgi:hypothetical protein
MSEKAAEVDQMKGATLEEISYMVEQIGREFRSKQLQLQPMMEELKVFTIIVLIVCDGMSYDVTRHCERSIWRLRKDIKKLKENMIRSL